MPNKAASQAAMGLGCFVFIFCILIPYIVCWAFVPLYVTLLIIGAFKKFNVDNPAFTFLFPLVPFVASCVLCLFFWWAIPSIVNAVDELLILFKPGELTIYRETIPDGMCFFYFILFIGGSIGSLFSIVSLGLLFKKNNTISKSASTSKHSNSNKNKSQRIGLSERQAVWQQTAPPIGQIVKPFKENCKRGKYSVEAANDLIRTAVNIWAHDNFYTQRKADEIYERLKIKPTI